MSTILSSSILDVARTRHPVTTFFENCAIDAVLLQAVAYHIVGVGDGAVARHQIGDALRNQAVGSTVFILDRTPSGRLRLFAWFEKIARSLSIGTDLKLTFFKE
jgi:hypothetical protein